MPRLPRLAGVLSVILLAAACGGDDDGPSTIYVAVNAPAGGDGSSAKPLGSISAAITMAGEKKAATVKLAPGRYELSASITIRAPIELRGSQQMMVDADGLPTGAMAGTETVLVAAADIPAAAPLVVIGSADGPLLQGVTVRDLTFEAGDGDAVQVWKTKDFLVQDNVIKKAGLGINTNASSGRAAGNHISGVGACGLCISAGSPAFPSVVEIAGNRSVGNGAGGILLNGGPPFMSDTDVDHLDVTVKGNDASDNTGMQPGFGIRIIVMRRDPDMPGAAQKQGNVKALIQDNRLSGNRAALTIDAGFPYREYPSPEPTLCDTRVYTGSFDLTFKGNRVEGSVLKPAIITFTRITVTQNPGQRRLWQYLHGATFKIDDAEGNLTGYQLDHPAADPYTGTRCEADAAGETLGNTFIYNGTTIPPT